MINRHEGRWGKRGSKKRLMICYGDNGDKVQLVARVILARLPLCLLVNIALTTSFRTFIQSGAALFRSSTEAVRAPQKRWPVFPVRLLAYLPRDMQCAHQRRGPPTPGLSPALQCRTHALNLGLSLPQTVTFPCLQASRFRIHLPARMGESKGKNETLILKAGRRQTFM